MPRRDRFFGDVALHSDSYEVSAYLGIEVAAFVAAPATLFDLVFVGARSVVFDHDVAPEVVAAGAAALSDL